MTRFEWEDEKDRKNLLKHSVSFAEAQTVFDDPLARIDDDPDHSLGEQREVAIGYSLEDRLLLISFVQRGDTVRIISARIADRHERKSHEEETL